MTDAPRMVIVGAGHAGGRAAVALRDAGWTGAVTVVGNERHAPYERPPLSKELLAGSKTADDCALHGRETYVERGIDLVTGVTATDIKRASGELVLSDGRSLCYDKLLLATGAEPRRLDVPGADLDGVLLLRTLDDSRSLADRLTPSARLTIIGGGLIGLEVAASAAKRGCAVTVVEIGDRLLSRVAPEAIAGIIAERHRQEGVSLHLGRSVAAIAGDGTVEAVHLDDGTEIATDTVMVSIGVAPRVDLAERAGLAVDNGIVTDATLRTDDPHIFAAGDACVFPHPLFGQRIRLESWKNAEDQGPLAARNMLGAGEAYSAVPWMWSDQYDLTIQVAGFPGRTARLVDRRLESDALAQFHLGDDGRLVAVSGVGPVAAVARTVRLGQMMIERQSVPEPGMLSDPTTNLKTLLRQQAA